jgi:hypothetical protein
VSPDLSFVGAVGFVELPVIILPEDFSWMRECFKASSDFCR